MNKESHNSLAGETLYLIDVSSFIYRAYYSVGHLSRSDGVPTGAVFGVANMLTRLVADVKPTHLAAVMDSRTPTFRKEIYPEYKANRPPVPEDLKVQFPLVDRLLRAFNIPTVQLDGYEADDLIATLCGLAVAHEMRVVIVSGDKDLMQLVSPNVVVLDTMKDKTWDEAAVLEKWGVVPAVLGDLLAIAGDSSDNIPGVPRLGPKTAAPLLAEHGSLGALLEAAKAGALKSKATAARLVEHESVALLSRRLVALCDTVPLENHPQSLAFVAPDKGELAAVLDELEFRALRDRLIGPAQAPSPGSEDHMVFRTIANLDQLRAACDEARQAGRFAVDLETTSVDPVRAEIIGVALAWKHGEGHYVPVAHRTGNCLALSDVLGVLQPLLEDGEIGVIAQNAKYEDIIFARHGVHIARLEFDPMLASYLLRVDSHSHGLDALAGEVLGLRTVTYDEVTQKSRGHQLCFDEVDVAKATDYAAEDALVALHLSEVMAPQIREQGLEPLLRDVELPVCRVLARMETSGVAVDVALLSQMSESFEVRLAQLENEAHVLAGRAFNLASPKQLSALLFEELGLPPVKKTKTGQSTDSEVLEELKALHPLPALLLEHRLLSKLKGTYLDALPRLVNPRTGRIHTSFNQAVAATGRLSSSNPNLQNIPIRSELGREIRRAFVAAPGHRLISADYSQIELRILAHLSGDDELCRAFETGQDVHTRTARALFGYGGNEQVSAEHRAAAKAVNFGVIYGKGEFSLGKELGISRAEAGRFIREYFRVHSHVARFMEQTIEDARRERSVTTLLGRKRPLRDIDSSHHVARQAAERMARNTPIQGSAADLLKLAMIRVDERLRRETSGTRMILTVHDELVLEAPCEEVETATAIVKQEMENAMSLRVPLVVDVGVGQCWSEAH
jgi:DNA polymerase-1